MAFHFLVTLLVIQVLVPWPAASQDCSLPDGGAINTRLRSLLISVGGEGAALVTTLLDHHFTCLAVGSSRDQYRQVSVAIRYTKNTASGQFTAQFPLRCTAGNFDTVGELDQSPPANVFDISTRRDCFTCTTVDTHAVFIIDAIADCALCDGSCLTTGQGGCATSPADCCPFYNTDDSCTTSCDTNFAATPGTNYTCACNLSCENGGTLNGDNCTHCLCSSGFTGVNCEINIDDCASNPCVNGTCTDLVDGYNCTCQAGFTGTNCDVELCTLTCANGGTLDIINCTCDCLPQFTGDSCVVAVDKCSSNPCQNNGTCNNTFPGFECMCAVGYTGMTCEVCATGYMMESGQCVQDCNSSCLETTADTFDFNICLFMCLITSWYQRAEECGISLPNITDAINTSLSMEKQWDSAMSLWTQLHNAWAMEADHRGFNVAFPTTTLDNSQSRLDQWKTSSQQWRMDHQTWQTAAAQLSPGFPKQDLSSLNFTIAGTLAQQSATYSAAIDHWIAARSDYDSNLADQCPVQ